jgi:hypothetical protein
MSRHRDFPKGTPTWMRELHTARRNKLLQHVRSGGITGIVTTNQQLADTLGLPRDASDTILRRLRASGQIEIVGERGNPVIVVRALERVA